MGLARHVLDELLMSGVRDVVLCPGSRSGPIAVTLFEADKVDALRLHVRIDERTAGFLALGMSKSSSRPVAVVTTSGTAVANLHPAVLEAHHAGVRLVVVSADRPAELRRTGANQTTDQIEFFGAIPFASFASTQQRRPGDVFELVAGAGPGPCQINLEFSDPLLEPPTSWTTHIDSPRPDRRQLADGAEVRSGPRTVVVAGDDSDRFARLLAERGNWPLFAEPSSGSRTGTRAIVSYRLLLAHSTLADRIERVIVFGHPTLSRPITRLLADTSIETLVVGDDLRGYPNSGEHVRLVRGLPIPDRPDDDEWIDAWKNVDLEMCRAVDLVISDRAHITSLDVARVVSESVPAGGLLFVGSSSPIRDLDLVARPYSVGQKRVVLANRGLSGIDGTLSSAIGAALARPSTRAIAYVGDLTFLHDINGLAIGPDETRPDVTIVVASDDGGSIFSTLEQGDEVYSESFDRIYRTSTGVSIAAACAAYGIAHSIADSPEELTATLGVEPHGIRVVEVMLDGAARRPLADDVAEAAIRVCQKRY